MLNCPSFDVRLANASRSRHLPPKGKVGRRIFLYITPHQARSSPASPQGEAKRKRGRMPRQLLLKEKPRERGGSFLASFSSRRSQEKEGAHASPASPPGETKRNSLMESNLTKDKFFFRLVFHSSINLSKPTQRSCVGFLYNKGSVTSLG